MKILLSLFAALLATQSEALAEFTLDFNNYSNGTAVFAANPYPNLLDLEAEGTAYYYTFGPNGLAYYALSQVSTVIDGSLQVLAPLAPDGLGYPNVYNNVSHLTATFYQPVVALSFDAYCFRFAGYSYSGFDAAGAPFSFDGSIAGIIDGGPFAPPAADPWVTFTLSIPAGGYLTAFSVVNHDPGAFNGAFWIDNISFAIVPEPSTLTMLTIGAGFTALLGWRLRMC